MIAAKEKLPALTPEEYFTWEEQQLEKHELIDGQLYTMTGGSKNHSLLAARLITLFRDLQIIDLLGNKISFWTGFPLPLPILRCL